MFSRRLSEDCIVAGAPAKVNLFLQVLRKRPDGYHDINSLFQAVSLFDRLKLRRTDRPGVDIRLTNDCSLPLDDNNLIARAYRAIADDFNTDYGLEVELEKNIPVAAGLGGGSSDAATTLMACNSLFGLGLDGQELTRIGLEVGSDIPFFFGPGQAIVTGRGEIVTPSDFPTDYWLVLITPKLEISTADSYANLAMDLTKPRTPFKLSYSGTARELAETLCKSDNDFEQSHFETFPELKAIKDGLLDRGAVLARMSGSGPTVFGIYTDAPVSEKGEWRDALAVRSAAIVRPVSLRV